MRNTATRSLLLAVLCCPIAFAQAPVPVQESTPPTLSSSEQGADDGVALGEAAVADSEGSPAPDSYIQLVNEEIEDRIAAGAGGTSEPDGLQSPTSNVFYSLRVVAALCFVLVLVILAGYVARRVARRTPLLAGSDLGTVLGRLYLARGSALHFVRTGGRILVIGVTNDNMSLVAEFGEEAFDASEDDEEAERFDPDSFVAHLRETEEELRSREILPGDKLEDEEIASLRGDIRRLQGFLREESRESRD